MDVVTKQQLDPLVGLIKLTGGAYPMSDNGYQALAEVTKLYPKGQKIWTPDGEDELVVGVDLSFKYPDSVPPGLGGLHELIESQDPTAQAKFEEMTQFNQQATQKTAPFYLTPTGHIWYSTEIEEGSPSYPIHLFKVDESQIPDAEKVLINAQVVSYIIGFAIGNIIGSDGTIIDDIFPRTATGTLELR